MLEEIMQGYFMAREPLQIKYSYNKNNIAYIPKIGYFEENNPTSIASILEIEGLEVVKELHPLMHRYLFESYKGEITNPNPEYNSVWSKHKNTLSQALLILKNQALDFYNDFLKANKKIFIHDNPKILNFTSKETLGMLFFYATPKATLMYFIEELIHQGAHNILYHITFNEKEYFKIDARNTLMRDLTGENWDYRDVYGAFHGIFTIYKRLEVYDVLMDKGILKGQDKHELLGRITDQFPRYHTGLEKLNLDEVYTEKGKILYQDLDKKTGEILEKYKKLKTEFDISNRDLDFRYEDFVKLNPYDEFLEKDTENYYKF